MNEGIILGLREQARTNADARAVLHDACLELNVGVGGRAIRRSAHQRQRTSWSGSESRWYSRSGAETRSHFVSESGGRFRSGSWSGWLIKSMSRSGTESWSWSGRGRGRG